jgi:Bardet-Biedl syndrome 4 protein
LNSPDGASSKNTINLQQQTKMYESEAETTATLEFSPQSEIEKEKRNWLIHLLFVRHDFEECLKVVELQLGLCHGLCEYALYVKACIKRYYGEIHESLQLFQAATMLNPQNPANLKQVGRSLFLLGKHADALEIYDETQKISPEDWDIWHNKGLCHLNLKNFAEAEDSFMTANAIQRHESTYMQLGKVYTNQEKYQEAIEIYLEALEYVVHYCHSVLIIII